jgi:hypothetical protein
MDVSITVKAFDEDGVLIIPPTHPDFDALARPLIGRVADVGLQLKPMLAIVSNESQQTVVSYSKTWTARYSDGRTSRIRSHTSFPETVCGDILIARDPEALPPGAKRIEAANLVIQGYAQSEPYYDQFLGQFIVEKDQMLAHAKALSIELDAVIFADGTVVGTDQDHWLTGLFSEYVSEKQAWYREILSRLDAGASVEDAYAPLRVFQQERSADIRTPQPGHRHLQLWKTQAAADAQRWRRTFSDDELPQLLKRLIRLEPFEIRRRPDLSPGPP